jgi:hypothetical protein
MPKTMNSCNALISNGFHKKYNFEAIKINDVLLTVRCNRRVREWRVTLGILLVVSTVSSFVSIRVRHGLFLSLLP